MKNALLALLVVMAAAPAFAGSSEDDARQEERKFFDFSGFNKTTNPAREGDNKRCVSAKVPDSLKTKSVQEQQIVYAAYKYVVVRKVSDPSKCTCENVFPPYDEAMQEFKTLFGKYSLPVPYDSPLGTKITKYINGIDSSYDELRLVCAKNKVR
jgi:hypothetical protein